MIASIANSIALNFVAGSVYQMMRGGNIVTCFFFTVVFLKVAATKHQIFGSVFTVVGIMVVGASNIIFSDSSESSSSSSTVQTLFKLGSSSYWHYLTAGWFIF